MYYLVHGLLARYITFDEASDLARVATFINPDEDVTFDVTVDSITPSNSVIIVPIVIDNSKGETAITEQTEIIVSGGDVKTIYDGGNKGATGISKVVVNSGNIDGNIYGGGEGETATVYTSTSVEIDLKTSFEVTETPTSTETITSGEIKTEVTNNSVSYIKGNIYDGGTQSRLYSEKGEVAATVNIIQEKTDDKIVITWSVFGGGAPGIGDFESSFVENEYYEDETAHLEVVLSDYLWTNNFLWW